MYYNFSQFKNIIEKEYKNSSNIYAVIGNPIAHSMSPLLHSIINKDCKYFKVEINENELFDFCNFAKKYLKGFNVTVPHKKNIIQYLDNIDNTAKNLNSVNTVQILNDKLYGYNTDVYGLEKAFQINNIDYKNKNVLILGAGGSAASAIYLSEQGKANISIAVRNVTKAKNQYPSKNILNINDVKGKYDIVINCTPCGMKGQENQTAIDINNINGCKHLFDLVYNPLKTKLMKNAEKNNIKAVNGIDMLIHQGIKAQNIWGNEINSNGNINNMIKAEIIKERLYLKNKKGIALCGFMGCGKSSIGKLFYYNYGFKHIDTDNNIEKIANQKISDIFKQYGEKHFRDLEKTVIENILYCDGVNIVSLGGGAVTNEQNVKNIKQNCILIYIETSLDYLLKRANDGTRPLLNKNVEDIKKLYNIRKDIYNKVCDVKINGNNILQNIFENIIDNI